MNVRLEIADHVARVTIDRPDKLNAVDAATEAELEAVWRRLETARGVRAIVLTGAGDRAFCAGADLTGASASGVDYWLTPRPHGFGGLSFRDTLDIPVIGRVNGHALGGCFEMVLGCDIVIAAEEATFGLTEPRPGALLIDGNRIAGIAHGEDVAPLCARAAHRESGMRVAHAPMLHDRHDHDLFGFDLPDHLRAGVEGRGFSTHDAMVAAVGERVAETRGDARVSILPGPNAPQRQLWPHGIVHELARRGLPAPGTSLADGVWAGPDAQDLIARRGATVAHNPASNLMLGSGLMDLVGMARRGVVLALGSGSANRGGLAESFEAMRLALMLARRDQATPPSAASFAPGARGPAHGDRRWRGNPRASRQSRAPCAGIPRRPRAGPPRRRGDGDDARLGRGARAVWRRVARGRHHG
jgi:hypothetical protein